METLCRALPDHEVTQWNHIPRYRPFVMGIHRSPVDSLHKGPVTRTALFSLVFISTKCWINRRAARDLRRHGAHCHVIVMLFSARQTSGPCPDSPSLYRLFEYGCITCHRHHGFLFTKQHMVPRNYGTACKIWWGICSFVLIFRGVNVCTYLRMCFLSPWTLETVSAVTL